MTSPAPLIPGMPSLADVVRMPHAWTEYVTSNPTPQRLRSLLDELAAMPRDGVVAARMGHVLMLLGRPRDAVELLVVERHRLARAQRLLALAQIARIEGIEEYYIEIASHPPHFGMAINPIELEAQMRLDYVLGIAHTELGGELGPRHFDLALHVSTMVGAVQFAAAIAAASVPRRDRLADPRGHAYRLSDLAQAAHARGNLVLTMHLLKGARQHLMGIQAFAEIAALEESWQAIGPDAGALARSARTLDDPRLPPPPLDNLTDELLILAHAFYNLHAAARAADALDPVKARAHAAAVLRLPSWPERGERSSAEVAYRTLRILAHLYDGNHREATVALRDAVNDRLHHVRGTGGLHIGLVGLELAAHGVAYPSEFTPIDAFAAVSSGLSGMDYDTCLQVMRRALHVVPNAVSFMAGHHSAVSGLTQSIVAFLPSKGPPRLAGKKVRNAPEASGEIVHDLLETGSSTHHNAPVSVHRYNRAIGEAGCPPVVYSWRVERLKESLSRFHPALRS